MNKIDAVARAICYSIELGCDGECARDAICRGGPAPLIVEAAKAAIEALREPTEAMIDAGWQHAYERNAIPNIWQAMIEEALK